MDLHDGLDVFNLNNLGDGICIAPTTSFSVYSIVSLRSQMRPSRFPLNSQLSLTHNQDSMVDTELPLLPWRRASCAYLCLLYSERCVSESRLVCFAWTLLILNKYKL